MQLQADVDDWLKQYNELRPHSGRYCYGKTPLQTFSESKHIAQEKQVSSHSVGGGHAVDHEIGGHIARWNAASRPCYMSYCEVGFRALAETRFTVCLVTCA